MNLLLVIVIQASFYALLGMGYVLIYRATRVLNLAHGDLMVFGAFLFFQALVLSNGNLALSVITGLGGAAVLGALIYLGIMRPLAGYPVAVGVLATIALGILLRSIVDVDLVGTDTLSGRISRAARPADRNDAGFEHQRDRYRDHCGRAGCDDGLSVVAAAGRGRRGDAGRGRKPAAGGAARHQYS